MSANYGNYGIEGIVSIYKENNNLYRLNYINKSHERTFYLEEFDEFRYFKLQGQVLASSLFYEFNSIVQLMLNRFESSNYDMVATFPKINFKLFLIRTITNSISSISADFIRYIVNEDLYSHYGVLLVDSRIGLDSEKLTKSLFQVFNISLPVIMDKPFYSLYGIDLDKEGVKFYKMT